MIFDGRKLTTLVMFLLFVGGLCAVGADFRPRLLSCRCSSAYQGRSCALPNS